MIDKCELDASGTLFRELKGRFIRLKEQIKLQLFKNANFIIYAVVEFNGNRIDVNLFANKYFSFPIESGIFPLVNSFLMKNAYHMIRKFQT